MNGDLISLLLKLVPLLVPGETIQSIKTFLGIEQEQIPQPQTVGAYLSAKDLELLLLKKRPGAVIDIIGGTGTGKTELAYRLAQFIGKPVYAVSPDPKRKHPSFVTPIDVKDIDELVPPRATVIYDDVVMYASNQDYSNALVHQLEKDIPMVEHPDLERHIIFITQNMAIANRYIMLCHMAFFKPPGLLYADLERPNIRKIYKDFVDPAFNGKGDDYIKTHAFMFSRTYKGLIKVKMVEQGSR